MHAVSSTRTGQWYTLIFRRLKPEKILKDGLNARIQGSRIKNLFAQGACGLFAGKNAKIP
jgi:hypothetical protein